MPHETHLQSMLDELRTRLLVMGAAVEEAVANACGALCGGDPKLAHAVIEADTVIDALENEVDDMTLSLMARAQPVARDLRFVVSALRMVVELERIGDEAVCIAERSLLLRDCPSPSAFGPMNQLINQMISLAKNGLHDALSAFRDEDIPLALKVCRGKDDILQLEVNLLQNVMQTTAPVLHVILIARSLTRIFGRSANIAEQCYFMKQGVSIKHKKPCGQSKHNKI